MDLRRFINTHIEQNTIDVVKEGFGKSAFVDSTVDLSSLVKTLLSSMIQRQFTTKSPTQCSHYDIERNNSNEDPNNSLQYKSYIQTFHVLDTPGLSDAAKQKRIHSPYLNQLRSGGLTDKKTTNAVITTQTEELQSSDTVQLSSGANSNAILSQNIGKKHSYCADFIPMTYNIQGIVGAEMSKFLFYIMGVKQLMKNEIDCIKQCNNYTSLLYHVQRIYNLLIFGDDNKKPSNQFNEYGDISSGDPITIDEDFFTAIAGIKNIDRFIVNTSSSTPIAVHSSNPYAQTQQCFRYDSIEILSKKHQFIKHLIERLIFIAKSDNILMFEDDREAIVQCFNELMNYLQLGTYFVNNVDDLCINVGCTGFVYDKSFIKMFEILYKETFADIPYSEWGSYKPYRQILDSELNVEIKYNKHHKNFSTYFKKIHTNTFKSVNEVLQRKDALRVVLTESFLEQMTDIMLNLFLMMIKKMANEQINQTFFGKSNRVQFIQVYKALIDCAPRITSFSDSQRMMLHYILLSAKTLNASYDVVKNERIEMGIDSPETGKVSTKSRANTCSVNSGGLAKASKKSKKKSKSDSDESEDEVSTNDSEDSDESEEHEVKKTVRKRERVKKQVVKKEESESEDEKDSEDEMLSLISKAGSGGKNKKSSVRRIKFNSKK